MLGNIPKHFDDPEFRKDVLSGLAQTANRIQRMIGRLSSLRDHLEPRKEICDLNGLVESALEQVNGVISGLDLERRLQPLPKVAVDREQMESVVTNLLTNAAEAMEGEGRVQVETRSETETGEAVLVVTDSGCGMEADFIRNVLFRPFQSTKNNGIGVGMFQCRAIVEAHGGTIEVESEPGKGTRFRVGLPVSEN
jgi:signal transduction histidine kinase